jgi:tetratricopeptide (TPR) repeat protein
LEESLDSETIIVGIVCLFLAILFFPFKPQLLILLNRLARFEFSGTKNLQYIDQDSEPELPNINQDIKPELPIPFWLTLTKEKFAARIIIFAILSTSIYIVFNSVSGVLVRLGNIEFSAGNEKLGIVSYDLALEFNNDLKKAVNQCYADNAQKQYKLAVEHCSKVIDINEQYTAAYINRGWAYYEQEKYDLAISDFTNAMALNSRDSAIYQARGLSYMALGKYELAIIDFTKEIDIDPSNKKAYFGRGAVFGASGKHDSAIIDFTKAIEIDPNYIPAYYLRGQSYALDGKYESAVTDYSKVIEIDPNYKRVYFYRGSTYVTLGKNDLAIADLTKAIENDSTKAEVFVWLGHAYANSQQFPKAITAYNKAITLSQEAYTYCVLGVTYTKMDNFSSAISSLEEGTKLDRKGELSWCKTALENAQHGIPTP